MLKEDTTRKERVNEIVTEFEACNSKEYKVEAIWKSAVYASKAKGYLPSVYYLLV